MNCCQQQYGFIHLQKCAKYTKVISTIKALRVASFNKVCPRARAFLKTAESISTEQHTGDRFKPVTHHCPRNIWFLLPGFLEYVLDALPSSIYCQGDFKKFIRLTTKNRRHEPRSYNGCRAGRTDRQTDGRGFPDVSLSRTCALRCVSVAGPGMTNQKLAAPHLQV